MNSTRAEKYLVQFSIWNSDKKSDRKTYIRKKKFFKVLWKWCLFEKKFLFFNEKLSRRSFV